MRIKLETVIVFVMLAITCAAWWQIYSLAESIRPIVDAIDLAKNLKFW
jgi:hypothetical protein